MGIPEAARWRSRKLPHDFKRPPLVVWTRWPLVSLSSSMQKLTTLAVSSEAEINTIEGQGATDCQRVMISDRHGL